MDFNIRPLGQVPSGYVPKVWTCAELTAPNIPKVLWPLRDSTAANPFHFVRDEGVVFLPDMEREVDIVFAENGHPELGFQVFQSTSGNTMAAKEWKDVWQEDSAFLAVAWRYSTPEYSLEKKGLPPVVRGYIRER